MLLRSRHYIIVCGHWCGGGGVCVCVYVCVCVCVYSLLVDILGWVLASTSFSIVYLLSIVLSIRFVHLGGPHGRGC